MIDEEDRNFVPNSSTQIFLGMENRRDDLPDYWRNFFFKKKIVSMNFGSHWPIGLIVYAKT